ncbi:Cof-type HAD-IIB family hydrolase [Rouxiella sp. S1S-2]|uniref:Cof-type HAD-IIB family hydrolase n=1 Tax=Rouxiella sp. S1S-2 TaxID=2653856 RepID=UPI00126595F8|nr:Cof-type HAD-IIB family hydrolase [Rouxiella sp. S1S-2]KAB7894877.1 Cof-type HAD-IIB family hydrolase [Rouxiella sp. S1S-2]
MSGKKLASVKLIAVDMDGTFLDDQKEYNKAKFLSQYQQLKQRGIKFVVASGNQYYQLKSFFPEIASEIAFVAENGGYIVKEGQDLSVASLSAESVAKILEFIDNTPGLNTVVCGKDSAYILASQPDAFYQKMQNYYHRLKKVESYQEIDDTIFKFATNIDDEHLANFMTSLDKALGHIITPVSSGHGSADLIIPGRHKANGLRMLQEIWGIDDSEVVTFGDGGNDVEMLKQAGYGFAMANGMPAAKAAASYSTVSNNEEGVLKIIDSVLAGDAPFNV